MHHKESNPSALENFCHFRKGTLPETNSSYLKIGLPKRFSGAMLVPGRVTPSTIFRSVFLHDQTLLDNYLGGPLKISNFDFGLNDLFYGGIKHKIYQNENHIHLENSKFNQALPSEKIQQNT